MSTWCIQLAAGQSTRFGGDTPKPLIELLDQTVLAWSVRAAAEACDSQVVVAPPSMIDAVEGLLEGLLEGAAGNAITVVEGGEQRSDSVRAGLAVVPADADVIVVHDAARPAASTELFELVVEAVRSGADAAVPGVPVVDTIKRIAPGSEASESLGYPRVVETLDREGLVSVQTPQAFNASLLRMAHAGGDYGTDDASLVERSGGTVVIVPGEPGNSKLTHPSDLGLLAEQLRARVSQ